MKIHALLFSLLAWVSSAAAQPQQLKKLPPLREGDIVFHSSRSTQSLAIQRATGSPYSHMGVVLMRDGRACVFEAVATVRCTPLRKWIARGSGGHFVAKRLRDAGSRLNEAGLLRLRTAGRSYERRAYDLAFDWSDEKMYCSELVWKMYRAALNVEIGALQRMREFKLGDAAVKAKLRERYGARVPLDQWVISPVAMFESVLLETVAQR